jgi:hypothetical protein
MLCKKNKSSMYKVSMECGIEEYRRQIQFNKEILRDIDDVLLRRVAEYSKGFKVIGKYYNLFPIILSKDTWSDKQRWVIILTVSKILTTDELREIIKR